MEKIMDRLAGFFRRTGLGATGIGSIFRTRKAAFVKIKSAVDSRKSINGSPSRIPDKPAATSQEAVTADIALQAETSAGSAKAKDGSGRKLDLWNSSDMEDLKKEVERIDKAINETIELSVMPTLRVHRESLDELIEKWSHKDPSSS